MAAVIGPRYSIDADAQSFITAAGLTDQTQINAINLLVINLKVYSIWTKFKTIYPFVGGTATTHKWNLKNPLDTNAAFRLTFSGGWTHSATGAKPNGTNAYADTYLIPSTSLTADYASLHYYSRTAGDEIQQPNLSNTVIGVRADNPPTVNNTLGLLIRANPGNYTSFVGTFSGTTTNNGVRFADSTGTGLFSGTLTAANSKIYKNGVDVTTENFSYSRNTPNLALYVGAINNKGSGWEWSLRESAFAAIADTLTDTEVANLYTAVQAYQTTLGRQI